EAACSRLPKTSQAVRPCRLLLTPLVGRASFMRMIKAAHLAALHAGGRSVARKSIAVGTRRWPLKRKLAHYSRKVPGGCRLWQGTISLSGQPRLWWKGRYRSVTRVVFELEKGTIPSGSFILHRCRRPTCIEPGHLYLGTHDMVSATINRPLGENHTGHK